jgi:hypothetical protein
LAFIFTQFSQLQGYSVVTCHGKRIARLGSHSEIFSK